MELDELDGLVASRLKEARRAASASGSDGRRAHFLGLLNQKKQRLMALHGALEDEFAGNTVHSDKEGGDYSDEEEEEFEIGPAAASAAGGGPSTSSTSSTSLPSQQQRQPGEKKKRKRKEGGGGNLDLLDS